ncbi:uncharacterized protein RCC_03834 [Ramularia collo-cygni]|nr:uncharacterized protein RCC_03834 [Ramularia collo-cygni]CZT17997.1 uncharacterized protein RCC_03834 [Ramularia collo-cygni]
MGYIEGHIEGCGTEGLKDRDALTEMGLSTDFQDRLLDPNCFDILRTRELKEWVLEFLECNLIMIPVLLERSKSWAGRSRRASMENTLDDFYLPSAQVTIIESRPALKMGHTMLYKAIPGLRCKNWIETDGSINVAKLITHGGGDFNRINPAFYWTQELATAEKYRFWQQSNIRNGDIWIISIQVPTQWIKDTFKYTSLEFSNPWKQYVWHCKSQRKPRPEDMQHADADWIHGHICTGRTERVTDIAKADIETVMTDEFLLMNKDVRATQDCIMNVRTMEEVFRKAGQPHVDVAVAVPPKGAVSNKGKAAKK